MQNAHLNAYDDVYVQENSDVSLSGAPTAIGQKVIDDVIKHYGGSLTRDSEGKLKCETTYGKAAMKIEQEIGKDATVTIVTRDNKKKGSIKLDGGILVWKDGESATPAEANVTHNERNLMTGKTIVENAEADQNALDWATLKRLAEIIAEEETIDNDTKEVEVTYGGKNYKLGIGDVATVYYNDGTNITGKTVRILGFNHDIVNGTDTENGEKGISFEFKDKITDERMKGWDANSNGWGASSMRTACNGTYLNALTDVQNDGMPMSTYIKTVKKDYLKVYNGGASDVKKTGVEANTGTGDKLWLLSCSEIWGTSAYSGCAAGYCKQNEGEQYAFYKKVGARYRTRNSNVVKNGSWWWLRSPYYDNSKAFCTVDYEGCCDDTSASRITGVAPGFTI